MNYLYIKALGLSNENINFTYNVIKKDGVEWVESCKIAVETHYKWVCV